MVLEDDEDIYAYTRTLDKEKYIIITNLSNKEVKYSFKECKLEYKNLLISNYRVDEHCDLNEFILKPYEARLYKITK